MRLSSLPLMEFLILFILIALFVVNVKSLQQSSSLKQRRPTTTSTSISATVDGFPVEKIDVPLLSSAAGKELYFYKIREWQRTESSETSSQDQECESKPEHAGLTQLGISFDPHADPRRRVYVKETFTYGGKLWPSGLVSDLLCLSYLTSLSSTLQPLFRSCTLD